MRLLTGFLCICSWDVTHVGALQRLASVLGRIVKSKSIPSEVANKLTTPKREERAFHDTVIVGAGLAGLSAATYLKRAGKTDFVVLETSDVPGGRVQTDIHEEGYLLDRGFQVFLEEYPESRRLLQDEGYSKLELQPFRSGALVFYDGALHTVSDPLRAPEDLFSSLVSPIGSVFDKCKVGLYSIASRFSSMTSDEAQQEIFSREEKTTLSFLQQDLQLGDDMIERFFRPFYRGIFLSDLALQSSRMFEFVFLMFARASACLPKSGMGALGRYLADDVIGTQFFRYGARVQQVAAVADADADADADAGAGADVGADVGAGVSSNSSVGAGNTRKRKSKYVARWTVSCGDGAVIDCDNVVVAADPSGFVGLAKASGGWDGIDTSIPASRGSVCLYYGFDGPPPVESPTLVLNGDPDPSEVGAASVRVNNICFPSQVSSSYAPQGKSLASVTLVGSAETLGLHEVTLDYAVRAQLSRWWGPDTLKDWKLLRIYRVPYA